MGALFDLTSMFTSATASIEPSVMVNKKELFPISDVLGVPVICP